MRGFLLQFPDFFHVDHARRAPHRFRVVAAVEVFVGDVGVSRVVMIDQSPIGRTPRSNPATYTGAWTHIRDLFAATTEAQVRGWGPGRFSFNVKGGRCETCEGAGLRLIEMEFLPDVYVSCETCKGKRYNRETLEVRFKGKSVSDVLDMTVEEAVSFFLRINTGSCGRSLRSMM